MVEPSQDAPARERILAAAHRLFYEQGFGAVGVDTIIAEAGVAKMTLYRHFESKDALIVAYLEESDRNFWDWLGRETGETGDPAALLVAMLEAVERLAASPACLGCTFQGAAAEFPARDHRAHEVALRHKRAVHDRFARLAREAGLREPEALATHLLLLMDGAWVSARMFGPANPVTGLGDAARALIDAHR